MQWRNTQQKRGSVCRSSLIGRFLLQGKSKAIVLALQNVSHWLALPELSVHGFSLTEIPPNKTPPLRRSPKIGTSWRV